MELLKIHQHIHILFGLNLNIVYTNFSFVCNSWLYFSLHFNSKDSHFLTGFVAQNISSSVGFTSAEKDENFSSLKMLQK